MTDLNLDLEPVESAQANLEAARVMMQLEEWFNAKCDQIRQLSELPDDVNLKVEGGDGSVIDVKDKGVRTGMKLGATVTLDILGEWPVSISHED